MPECFEQDVVERDKAEAEKPGAGQRERERGASALVPAGKREDESDDECHSERSWDQYDDEPQPNDDRIDQCGEEARADAGDRVGNVDLLRRFKAVMIAQLEWR